MNRIKARTKDGKAVVLTCNQSRERDPKSLDFNGFPNSPATVKARALRMGLTLTGTRQGAR